jgi:hypothetical protein
MSSARFGGTQAIIPWCPTVMDIQDGFAAFAESPNVSPLHCLSLSKGQSYPDLEGIK